MHGHLVRQDSNDVIRAASFRSTVIATVLSGAALTFSYLADISDSLQKGDVRSGKMSGLAQFIKWLMLFIVLSSIEIGTLHDRRETQAT